MDTKNLPNHIVIIPDGNRRWAKQKGLAPWRGHLVGAEKIKELLQASLDLGIKCISFWVGSYENLTKRSQVEINVLFRIYQKYFHQLAQDKKTHQNKVKVNVFGRWPEILPAKAKQSVKEAIRATQNYNRLFLNFFIAYNGTDELLAAIRGIVKEGRKDKNLKITADLLKRHLWSGQLPPVDFSIRTGSQNDPHNSVGFMMWHCANSQLYFTKEFFPDFGEKELVKAINDFQKRERRQGR
ncbi:MAG: di-trans,poly-cis-decaprenylcistransferase [Candidatus Portnoybacteria bacterium CG03_land_8_20_14_0_80_41_10]|uniref:Isoprenyl transferase n=1 Tax=Candidatus Portnoybacteria bacterium CG03_land_8_20_14_0_80_41_10 TaxID=1974808 RepID=A0A2M7BUB9_9BACT|nr:MAG: di-trans,poly-cis-decaprenylcistransferase [Candidatus Portnoybacteria bacterium CG03_land_8_20_14_0_80_41_10]